MCIRDRQSRRSLSCRGRAAVSIHARAPQIMKTYVAKPSDRQRDWLLVDAEGKTLGRLASEVATMLRGKRKPEYTPHIDTCLLYTSDAADDLTRVDLGGRR